MELSWGRYKQFNLGTAKENFLSRIIKQESGCWEWTGAQCSKRYGTIGIAGKSWLAHRAAWLLFNNEDPGELCVCHKCDNGFCVNPDHLFLGTQTDNIHDMENKNRSYHPSGAEHGRAKLTWDDVNTVRLLASQGVRTGLLAERFGVSKPTILRIVRNVGWVTK
jgi:hypothetical protein